MILFTPKNVIVQGITGTHGSFHTKAMQEYGTNIIAGISPKKAGETIHLVPVYAQVKDVPDTIDASVIFVPAPFARGAIMEAIDADVPLIVCVTEGIPLHDMMVVKKRLATSRSTLIGPNCPGFITPGITKLGIIPATITQPGTVAVVSRSGTLTYETVAELTAAGIGQKYVIGIGGDPIKGLDFVDCLAEFENDPDVSSIVLIGEIGGQSEQNAAKYIKKNVTKPVVAYIAGHHAPIGVQMGHAGAILSDDSESAEVKTKQLADAGVIVCRSIVEIAPTIKSIARKS